MEKKFYSLLVLMAILISSFGQTGNDPEAKKIMDAVSAKFKSYKAVQAGFLYKIENGAGKAISSKKGTVFMKGTKYRVSFAGQEIFYDGTTLWTYDKSANEVQISTLDATTKTLTPQKLFTNFYDKDFLYKLNGEKKEGNKVLLEIEMTPNDKTRLFHKVYLLVDKATKNLYSTKVLEKAGNRYSYTVTTLNGKAVIPDAKFIFDKKNFPGVEEVDLR
jgi:outer membrane lipoprotein carrier protein